MLIFAGCFFDIIASNSYKYEQHGEEKRNTKTHLSLVYHFLVPGLRVLLDFLSDGALLLLLSQPLFFLFALLALTELDLAVQEHLLLPFLLLLLT
jgi:hypothetical protein